MNKTVFSSADILLPPFAANDPAWEKYAVIACDQFTSQPEYWEKAENIARGHLSALGLILPEAYLETEREEEQKGLVRKNMLTCQSELSLFENCLIYIERILPTGAVRRGIVGKLDLCEYDFSPDSSSKVRATEQTVVERIPPRVAVRKEAAVELPHVMIFANDSENKLFLPLSEKKERMELVYDFDLMLGGGHISGYLIKDEMLSEVISSICEYENSVSDGLIYAMGDGNHSLASAKAHFEQIRADIGDEALSHPARYALVEMVNLFDSAIEFEPIYRILTGEGALGFCDYASSRFSECENTQSVTAVIGEVNKEIQIPALHALTVGSLQMLIDDYIKENSAVKCDYIHGEHNLCSLAKEKGSVGFIFDGVLKSELFDYVAKNGTLPRKTFSMGSAEEKRYYIEARKIVK